MCLQARTTTPQGRHLTRPARAGIMYTYRAGGDTFTMAFDKQDYVDQYKRDHYDRINIFVPKGTKAKVQDIAKAQGVSVSALILSILVDKYNI